MPSQPPKKTKVYIDGFNLYFGLKASKLRKFYWLDVHSLSRSLMPEGHELIGVKYFTARVKPSTRDPHKHHRQNTYLEALDQNPLTQIIPGRYLAKKASCRSCKAEWTKFEEKETDVNIAMEMLADAMTGACDAIYLVSGDSDLTGPVNKIRELCPNIRITIAFPPKRISAELRKAAHAHFRIYENRIRQNQLPNPVVKPDGVELHKPSQWQSSP